MAKSGRKVAEEVECRGVGEGEALSRLMQAVAEEGQYKAVQVAHNRLQFARTFRPTWATVLGWMTVWLVGIGLLFFLVKTTETCVAVIESDHTGTRIRLVGKLTSETIGRITTALDDAALVPSTGSPIGAPRPGAAAGPTVQSVHGRDGAIGDGEALVARGTYPGPAQNLPVPSVELPKRELVGDSRSPADPPLPTWAPPLPARGASAPPASFDWGAAAAELSSAEVSAAGTPDVLQAAARPAIRTVTLDDGSEIDIGDPVLFGRDPSIGDKYVDARLVSINDPSKSVSKTHFALFAEDGEWWVEDLHSTNGVVVVASDGEVTALHAGLPSKLPDERVVVRFGERSISIGRAV